MVYGGCLEKMAVSRCDRKTQHRYLGGDGSFRSYKKIYHKTIRRENALLLLKLSSSDELESFSYQTKRAYIT